MTINAPSTIAMSAYSLAALGGPMTKAQLLAAFEAYQYQATAEQLDEALGLAVEREIMTVDAGVYSAVGARGWVAIDRDPSDEDGWAGWICKNLATGEKQTLESLMEEYA